MSNNTIKENFKEFYKEIKPLIGGGVIGFNKFDKSNIYSTEEKMIGQWIDGKPLYQKTFVTTAPSTVGEEVSIYNLSDLNIDNIVLQNMVLKNNGEFMPANWQYGSSSYAITSIHGRCTRYSAQMSIGVSAYESKPVYITLQYTKIADDVISIAEETDYSTEEKVIGTWIDGKPLYQKTVVIDNISSGWDKNIPHGISDVDIIYVKDGYYIHNNDFFQLWCYAFENNGLSDNQQYSVQLQFANSTNIRLQVGSARGGGTLYVTLQYTKTTD